MVLRNDMVRELKAKPDIGALPRLFERTPAHIAAVNTVSPALAFGSRIEDAPCLSDLQMCDIRGSPLPSQERTDDLVRAHGHNPQCGEEGLQIASELFSDPQRRLHRNDEHVDLEAEGYVAHQHCKQPAPATKYKVF